MSRRKPPELKVLEGNAGHRPLDLTTMFRPEVAEPSIPKWMTLAARKVWRRLMPDLLRYNLVSEVDQDALAMLCQTSARLAMIERAIAAKETAALAKNEDPVNALMDTTPNGLRVQSALYQILNREQDKLSKMLEMFGLRPDARAKVMPALRAQMKLFEGGGDKPAAQAASSTLPTQPQGFADFE